MRSDPCPGKRVEMSPSPTANRSFLHGGGGRAALISDKVVYATLDSLALKRARLPLQLLPVDNENVADERTEKADKERRLVPGKTSSKRSTCKVKFGTGHQWRSYSKYLIFSAARSENQPARVAATPTPTPNADPATIGRTSPERNEKKRERARKEESRAQKNAGNLAAVSPSLRAERVIIIDNDNAPNRSEQDDAGERDKREEERRSVGRQDSGSSGDYERVDVAEVREVSTPAANEPAVPSPMPVDEIEDLGRPAVAARIAAVRSRSADDLATGEAAYESAPDDDEEEEDSKDERKSRFTGNVLYYVPRHLLQQQQQQQQQQPKKKKKKKPKTRYAVLSGSLVSLRSLRAAPSRASAAAEPKLVTISPPTNFVHVASATNPGLNASESAVRSGSGKLVITHRQICATLPLLVGRDGRHAIGNGNAVRSTKVGPVVDDANRRSRSTGAESAIVAVADRSERTNYAEIKTATRDNDADDDDDHHDGPAKVLAIGQPAKSAIAPIRPDTYEPICEPSADRRTSTLPPANSSFLWSRHRAKNFPSDARENADDDEEEEEEKVTEVAEDAEDSEGYDDVGPSNFAAQAEESDYDDVGPAREAEPIVTAQDCEEIYDDVIPPAVCERERVDDGDDGDENDGYLMPASGEKTTTWSTVEEEPLVRLRTNAKARASKVVVVVVPRSRDDSYYAASNNEYSSVDECRPAEDKEEEEEGEEDEETDVYDDVGPSIGEERVNSLYAGSTSASVLGQNAKESEWEDLEEVSIATSLYPCPRNDSCGRRLEGQQVAAGKKRFVVRWSRKARKQRSRRSRRSIKTAATAAPPTAVDAIVDSASDDSTYESLYSCQPDDFSSGDSDAEGASDARRRRPSGERAYPECPTRPTPPPPREASLTETLGKRIRMLRRTWSITKGSIGRIRRRTFADEGFDDKEQPGNEHHHHPQQQQQQQHHVDKYFNFRRHFRRSIAGPPTFYLDENDVGGVARDNNNGGTGLVKDTIYTNSQYMGSGSDDSSKTSVAADVDHYSVLADQEPLYQFYAAAVARVAFESDSEGYEEVEGTTWKTGPAAATDLARSGQRMLWCHTPQVIHSGLLQSLTPEEKKIQEAKFEILTSEASYLNSLRVLENEFLNSHALMNEILTPVERKRLFGGVPSVLSASRVFLAELEAVWREDPMLPGLSDVLLRHAEKCEETYVAYCSNQVSIDTTLKELRARKGVKFLEAVKRIETRPACQNLSLHSFLMLPMQRVTRLPLLADAIVSKLSMGSSDRASWEKVLSSLSNVVAECNEGVRTAAQEAEMEALARKLEYSAKIKPIMLRGKQLVRSGSVVQLSMKTDTEYKLTFGKKFNKTPLYLLLLTDYLLVAKLKSNAQDESYTVVDACKRNLLALESASEESPFAGRNAMILTLLENHSGRHVEYVLTCKNNTERERWLEAVSPPKRGMIGETLYESWDCPQVMAKYPYSPNQPDELSLQPGDVINVLKKMADGWYHGEKLLDGEQGWFPANHTKEVASEHVRARNLKQRHRLLALSSSVIQQRKAKQNQGIH